MKHIMLDLETMSSEGNGAIISIGLCEFLPHTGEIGRTLETRCTLSAAREAGMHFSPDTVEWWLRQSKEAQEQLLSNPRHKSVVPMLEEARRFFLDVEGSQWDRTVWAKGPTFDCRLLRNAYVAAEIATPWHYSREACVRTMLMIAKANGWTDILEMEPEVAHGALSDAVHQAKQVMEVMKRLKR